MFFGHSLCWYEKVCCLEHLGILHRARMKICIIEPFPAYDKVGVNEKNFSLACVAGVKGVWGVGVRKRRRERKLQEPRLLHFAPYFNYPSCHFNDQSELGVRFSA